MHDLGSILLLLKYQKAIDNDLKPLELRILRVSLKKFISFQLNMHDLCSIPSPIKVSSGHSMKVIK